MTAVLSSPVNAGAPIGPTTPRSRWYWRNWPVVVKLAAVLLVPTIVALVAGVLRIVDEAGAAPGYARISQIVRVQQQLSDLIGAVERERDMATAFVATGRLADRRPLDVQFRSVDSSVQVVAGSAGQVGGLDFARSPLAALGGLGPLRASVTTGFGPVEVVVTEYSDAIDPLIELDSALTRQLVDVAVTNDAAAVHSLVSGREQISRQHAIVSAALYTGHLGSGQIEDLRTAAVRQVTDQDALRAALGPAERASAIAGVGPDAELSRQRLLQLVLNRGLAAQPLGASPADWDQRNAVVIDNIGTVEKNLRQRIQQTAQALLDQVRTSAGLNSVILFFALGLGVLVGIFVTRALLRPLGVLKRTALDVADRRLPEAMARIRDGGLPETAVEPVPVGTHEEIGQVARAFDEVHSQAIRLAGEQAQLRANVNDIFVNLSRRTQGLVERQLKLIDRLESGEQDPQQLDNLFQLDHLATRMRRNSENLLVLAGTDAANRSGRPVRLVDVLRAAVSEVEQYQRLVLQQPPAVLVLGRTASDLVHLLAELLDNATQFSPPESHVMVSSDFAPDGSVSIEVADRGVGMTEAELVEANYRLANPPVVDASVSRRMGLYVVGRLAGRHGIEVQLRRGDGDVGVWASVIMPSRLVRVASEAVEPSPTALAELTGTNGSSRADAAPPRVASAGDGIPVPRPDVAAKVDLKVDPEVAADVDPVVAADVDPKVAPVAAEVDPVVAADDGDGQETSGHPLLPQRLAQRGASAPRPARTPPAPPGPPDSPPVDGPAQSPADVAGTGSGADLFRPARATVAGPVGPVGPGPRVTLQHSTPIFDDVASAWFKEHEAVPVRWTSPLARGPVGAPTREDSSPNAPLPDAPAADAVADAAATKATASATAGSPPLMRRQPGRTLAESGSGDAGKPRSSGQPIPASTPPAGAPAQDWGAADDGWRAAEALALPASAEVTAMGLPRRQPRALLVPGAVGAAEPASAPARSAESIRGRLSSYQQGIREGRQTRRNLEQEADGSAPEHQGSAHQGPEYQGAEGQTT
ncbi:MAG: nitrate- and nitrite sensing domain-containing protein [Actinomycetota bacterium]|nr:nitrate- and nitrite sensing domain-containing protein [Actinomycetota bacterium]